MKVRFPKFPASNDEQPVPVVVVQSKPKRQAQSKAFSGVDFSFEGDTVKLAEQTLVFELGRSPAKETIV